jgi:hypothetical protein
MGRTERVNKLSETILLLHRMLFDGKMIEQVLVAYVTR